MKFTETAAYDFLVATAVVICYYILIVPFICCKIIYGIYEIMF